MAKLSAHGRELLRIMREQDIDLAANPDSSVTWRRLTRAHMADGKILEKVDVHFKPSTYQPRGESYSYGWKLAAKLKPGITPADAVSKVLQLIADGKSKYTVVSGGRPPVIISQARIMRAIESGEHIGFCKACGQSQGGCEPDARNYTCESCGQAEVYGAEEMLIAG